MSSSTGGRGGGQGQGGYQGRGRGGSQGQDGYQGQGRYQGRGGGYGRGGSQGQDGYQGQGGYQGRGGGYGRDGSQGQDGYHGQGGYQDRGGYRGRGGGQGQDGYQGQGGYRGRGRGGGQGENRKTPAVPKVYEPEPTYDLAPNIQTTKIEKQAENSYITSGSKGARMPHRPGYGTKGKEVLLFTNHFQMKVDSRLQLNRYSIEILAKTEKKPSSDKKPSPDKDKSRSKEMPPVGRLLKRIIHLLLAEHFSTYLNDIATDYKANIVCKSKLPIQSTNYNVVYRAEGEDVPSPRAKTYRLKLKSAGTVSVSGLIDYLASTQASAIFDSKDEVIQALNIIMGQYPKASDAIFSIGANKHWKMFPQPNERWNLGAGLQAIRGFFVSVKAAASGLLVNVNVKHVACYDPEPLADLIPAFLQENEEDYNKLGKFLKGVRIYVMHYRVRSNNAGARIPYVRTISGLATTEDGSSLTKPPSVPIDGSGPMGVHFFIGMPGSIPEASSSAAAGINQSTNNIAQPQPDEHGYISVQRFFCEKYHVTASQHLPVLNVGTKDSPVYLPAEVCKAVPGQPFRSKLSSGQTSQMINFSVHKPHVTVERIATEGPKALGFDSGTTNRVLTRFGIEVTPRLITVPGRVLNAPNVNYFNDKTVSIDLGSWKMAQVKFSKSKSLDSWSYLWIQGTSDPWGKNQTNFDSTMNQFRSKMIQLGLTCSPVRKGEQISVAAADATKIKSTLKSMVHAVGKPTLQLVVVVLPLVSTLMYNSIKVACDIDVGVHSVCVVASKLDNPKNQGGIFANMALKVNLKLGGWNQTLDPVKLGVISEGKTMVVGIDVTHPSPGSNSLAPSVAGIVASVDKWLSQWPADLSIQPEARQEMVSSLIPMMKSRLRLWQSQPENKGLPENLLIYRDGVSEGQYKVVLEKELPLIRQACENVYPKSDTDKGLPRITIVVVGKRHNTRFYPAKSDIADYTGNPESGTIVDRVITQTKSWDFYLQSQTSLKGTARPAHYYVVWDEIFSNSKVPQPFNNAAEVLEDLTFAMCHLFGRATKTVSICPAVYYADLVCERARRYLSRLYDDSGSNSADAATDLEISIEASLKHSMFYI